MRDVKEWHSPQCRVGMGNFHKKQGIKDWATGTNHLEERLLHQAQA